MSYKIIWKQSPNYRSGRSGCSIVGICDHQTAGQYPGCVTWMCNPKAQASAHYVISRTGEIVQMVEDEDVSWHAGVVANPSWSLYDGTNPNKLLIGVEHECYPDVGGDGNLTEEQYKATLWLHKQLIEKWNIPIDRNHIIGHYQIDSVNRPNCPGSAFPWDRLMNDLLKIDTEESEDDDMNYDKFKEYMDKYENEKAIAEPSDWSQEARNWAESTGIIVGDDNGKMQYKANCTREQMVIFLNRLWLKINK